MTIAFWCVFVASFLPYVAFSFVKGLNPRCPRAGVPALDDQSARAYGAHLNAFETYAPFAAAVIIAHVARGPSILVDILAILYVLARVAHLVAYLNDRQPVRSAMFTVGSLITVAIFISAAFH